jgi:aquaporin-4
VAQISLCFGLAVATMVWCISHVSGGHINPAVTIAFLVTRRISVVKAFFYIVAQTGGATLGAFLLYLCVHEAERMGITHRNLNITAAQAFGIETMITFVLVFTVFSTCDSGRDDLEGSGPLAIGLSVTLCHMFAATVTGSSMNPARYAS